MSIQNVEPNAVSLKDYSYEALTQMPEAWETSGFAVVDKEELIGVPFVVVGVTFRQSDQNNVGYVSLEAITEKNEKVVVNDGGTGIFKQVVHLCVTQGIFNPSADDALKNDTSLFQDHLIGEEPEINLWMSTTGEWNIEWNLKAPLKCRHGLRKSDYKSREVNGVKLPAGTTFYIA